MNEQFGLPPFLLCLLTRYTCMKDITCNQCTKDKILNIFFQKFTVKYYIKITFYRYMYQLKIKLYDQFFRFRKPNPILTWNIPSQKVHMLQHTQKKLPQRE